MRQCLVIAALFAAGCASAPSRPTETVYTDRCTATVRPAAALVYDPPITLAEAPLDLSREGRDEQAFLGYEDGRVTFFYIHQDDRQLSFGFLGRGSRFGNSGYFDRQAVSDTVDQLLLGDGGHGCPQI